MKYLKKYENLNNKKFESKLCDNGVYVKDYVSNDKNYFKNGNYDNIITDIKKLIDLNIKYDVYYFNSDIFGLLFKVLIKDHLTNNQYESLKELDFYDRGEDYKFTFDWIKIDEDMIDDIIISNKYNL